MIHRHDIKASIFIVLVLAFAISAHAPAQEALSSADVLKYVIQPNDTLCLISTRYYNAPTAANAIYNINKLPLDKANKTQVPGPEWIYPGTLIELPLYIRSQGIAYKRRDIPMNIELAKKVEKPQGINLDDLLSVSSEKIPKQILESAPAPAGSFKPMKSAPKAVRESMPEWFLRPDTGIETCARALCNRFEQLCYFECLSVSKRLLDGDQLSICTKLQRNSNDRTVHIPYDLDEETRGSCAELLE